VTASDVRRLYENFPYPSPDEEVQLIHDVAGGIGLLLPGDDLAGRHVLDAGCGTGHRLVALARRYPRARFLGLDPSASSLAVARGLAARHGAGNVEFVRGGIPETPLPMRFDLVVCSGVVHHMSDPAGGMAWLAGQLTDDGLLYVWLYHALGEHDRMLDRELVRLLAKDDTDIPLVRSLGITLSSTRYGASATSGAPAGQEQDVLDADAYLNPVVRPVRFADIPGLVAGAELDWCAVFGINTDGGGSLVDLGGDAAGRELFVSPEDLVTDPAARERVAGLSPLDRARLIELVIRPTGISLVAGRGSAMAGCAPHIRHNVLTP
jgi:SAM-dependent methyltransferase